MTKLSRQEYIEKIKREIALLASDVLDNKANLLEASSKFVLLLNEIDAENCEQELEDFVLIDSEIDHLPIGEIANYWNKEVLTEKQKEIAEIEKWACDFGLKSCRNLLSQFKEYI